MTPSARSTSNVYAISSMAPSTSGSGSAANSPKRSGSSATASAPASLISPACPLAARPELYVRALRPQRRLQRFEPVESRSQLLARLDPAPGTTQELAVGELGPGAPEGTSGPGVSVECRLEEPIGLALVVAQQRAAVEERRSCPCGRAVVGPRLVRGEPHTGGLPLTGADCGLDSIEPCPKGDRRPGDLSSGRERFLRSTAPELEREQRPADGVGHVHEAAPGCEGGTLVRQRTAARLVAAKRSDYRELGEQMGGDLMLANLPGEPEALLQGSRCGQPLPRPDLAEREPRTGLGQERQGSGVARAGDQAVVEAARFTIVAEEQGRRAGENDELREATRAGGIRVLRQPQRGTKAQGRQREVTREVGPDAGQ